MIELITSQLGEIREKSISHHITDGTYSLYNLLDYLLDFTGPAHIFFSSFSITEAAICHLQHLKETNSLLSIRCLLDSNLRKTKSPLLFFFNSFCDDLRLTLNHSKIILLHNERNFLTVIASANMSKNRRIESLIIDTNADTFSTYQSRLMDHFEISIPFSP